jgi:hypothetical protein
MALTHAEIARLLGRTRSLVTKYVQRGMPTDSAASARAWFDRHVQPRAQYMRAVPGRTSAAQRQAAIPLAARAVAQPALDDLEALAKRWLADRDPETLECIRDLVTDSVAADAEVVLPLAVWDALVGDRL